MILEAGQMDLRTASNHNMSHSGSADLSTETVEDKAERIWESILRRIDSASIWLKNAIESIL